jgi:hypothetical protein
LHGTSGVTRPEVECPQRHSKSIRRLIMWRVTELYGAHRRRRRRRCREDCVSGSDRLEDLAVQRLRMPPTPPMSAPGGLARRFWGTAFENGMPVMSLRDQSLPNTMARNRTLRRAVAVGEDAVKSVSSGLTDWKSRDAECADTTYVGARRPCTAFLGRRLRKSYACHVIAQAFNA